MNNSADIAFSQIISRWLPAGIPVFTSATGEIQPTDNLFCLVSTSDIQHVAGELHTGLLTVVLNTPALPDDPAYLADHRDIAKRLFRLLSDSASLAAVWSSTEISLRGTFLTNSSQATDGNRWQATFQLKIGLAPI